MSVGGGPPSSAAIRMRCHLEITSVATSFETRLPLPDAQHADWRENRRDTLHQENGTERPGVYQTP